MRQLKKEKQRILEKVKETETFKDAKEILEKYDPKSLADLGRKNTEMSPTPTPFTPQTNSQLRYRSNTNTPATRSLLPPNPYARTPFPQPNPAMMRPSTSFQTPQRLALMPPPTSRPILPQHRSVMEKLVDYVVGDGPSNRYALICTFCHSHNGMALKEEFEFLAFVCCYCSRFNPSRKNRPAAPRLSTNLNTSLAPLIDEPESDSDSTKGPASDRSKINIEDVTNDENNSTENQVETQVKQEPDTTSTNVTEVSDETQNTVNLNDTNINSETDNDTINPVDSIDSVDSVDDKTPPVLL